MTERESLEFIYSQVSEDVNTLYQYYREKKQLEDEKDTEKQLEILIDKKYIAKSFLVDLIVISDYYFRGKVSHYYTSMQDYQNRIRFLLDR